MEGMSAWMEERMDGRGGGGAVFLWWVLSHLNPSFNPYLHIYTRDTHGRTLEEHHGDIALVWVQGAVVVAEDDAPPQGAGVGGVVHLLCLFVGEDWG